MKKFIKGIYKKSIYSSDKGYVIGLFKVKETNDEECEFCLNKTITFTGYFVDLKPECNYIFYGNFIDHPRYGFQYQVSSFERIKPDDKDGIIQFLSSDLFRGVGEKMATSIVDTLGIDVLDNIIKDKSCLYLVPKLSKKKADSIYDTLIKYEESHNTIINLTDIGFNLSDALTIYNFYKENTMDIVNNNVYDLLDDVDLSFSMVDVVASKLEIDELDQRRIIAVVFHVMGILTFKTGNTFLVLDDILSEVNKFLHTNIEKCDMVSFLDILIDKAKVVFVNNHYYLSDIFDSEDTIVRKIKVLLSLDKLKYKYLDRSIMELEYDNNIKYDSKQILAIKSAISNNITIITGGPGSGKTTIIKAIIDLYQKINKFDRDDMISHVALLAPTGRASKRMSEKSVFPASTIHRFLKWNKDTNLFAVNEYEKDNHNLIIVDEVSMIDINLLSNLFKGLTDFVKIVLVGDYEQLPSVGPGNVLKDLIDSKVIDTVSLDLVYRQDEQSYINEFAYKIRNDEICDNLLDTRSDFTFLECSSASLRRNLVSVCSKFNEHGYDYRRVQVMAPMYNGMNGINNINKDLQDVFNKRDRFKKELVVGDVTYRVNDKVLQLVNLPDLNVFNGDIGVIIDIIGNKNSSNKCEIVIDFDGNIVRYTNKDFSNIRHAFCISIHKSQGSEFDVVIIPMCNSYSKMLYKKLIYTGVTRAKLKLILIGSRESIYKALKNNLEDDRCTFLKNKLEMMNK